MAIRTWNSEALKNAVGDLGWSGPNVVAGNTVTIGHLIGNKTYTYAVSVTNTDGSVQIGVDQEASLDNLVAAINGSVTGLGVTHSINTIAHLYVSAEKTNVSNMRVTAKVGGSTFETFPTLAVGPYIWANAVLTSGEGGDYGVADNWLEGVAPAAGDDVRFSGQSVASVTGGLVQAFNHDSISVNEDYTGDIGRRRSFTTFTADVAGGATTVSDTSNGWQVNRFVFFFILQTSGIGEGQFRIINSNTATVITVPAWDVIPDAGDEFEIFEYGRLTTDCTEVLFGGSGDFLLQASTAGAGAVDKVTVYNSAANALILVGGFVDEIIQTGGELEVNYLTTCPKISVIRSSGNPICNIDPDVSPLTTVENFGGVVNARSPIVTFRQTTGSSTIMAYVIAPTITTADLPGSGTMAYNSVGTLATLLAITGKADFSGNAGVTITDIDLGEDGELDLANGLKSVLVTNPVRFLSTGVPKITLDPGTTLVFA